MSDNAKVLARVVHHFTASAERVFDAWLDPTVASRWWFTTPGSESNNTTIDGRIGGIIGSLIAVTAPTTRPSANFLRSAGPIV